MDDIRECYRVLDLEPGASLEEIKRSYRELVRVWHPDRFRADATLRAKAEEKSKRINLAYERLCKEAQEAATNPVPEPQRAETSASQDTEDANTTADAGVTSKQQTDWRMLWMIGGGIAAMVLIIAIATAMFGKSRESASQGKTQPIAETAAEAGVKKKEEDKRNSEMLKRQAEAEKRPDLDVQVQIPAGIYFVGNPQEGIKAQLGAFEIDKYEVNIGEYAKFIAWCEQHPDREHEFDHPHGDRKVPHVNSDVTTLILNASQRGRRIFKQDADPAHNIPADPGVEIDLSSPMVGVTFWDAYAYACWRGVILGDGTPRNLPTEEEWEAAARGPRGFNYPWGDELKPDKSHLNAGYNPLLPGGTKTDDGYNYWAPVDKFKGDVSEFKVVGMAGNVCEWVYRKEVIKVITLLKGGSFASDPIPMWGRILKIPAEDAWYVHPAVEKKAIEPWMMENAGEAYFVGDDVTPSFRSLYVGFRTVKRNSPIPAVSVLPAISKIPAKESKIRNGNSPSTESKTLEAADLTKAGNIRNMRDRHMRDSALV